jgi:hypothetical protein
VTDLDAGTGAALGAAAALAALATTATVLAAAAQARRRRAAACRTLSMLLPALVVAPAAYGVALLLTG